MEVDQQSWNNQLTVLMEAAIYTGEVSSLHYYLDCMHNNKNMIIEVMKKLHDVGVSLALALALD